MKTFTREGIRDGSLVRRLDAAGTFAVYVEDRASQAFKVVDTYAGRPIGTFSRAMLVASLEVAVVVREEGETAAVIATIYDVEQNKAVWADAQLPGVPEYEYPKYL